MRRLPALASATSAFQALLHPTTTSPSSSGIHKLRPLVLLPPYNPEAVCQNGQPSGAVRH